MAYMLVKRKQLHFLSVLLSDLKVSSFLAKVIYKIKKDILLKKNRKKMLRVLDEKEECKDLNPVHGKRKSYKDELKVETCRI